MLDIVLIFIAIATAQGGESAQEVRDRAIADALPPPLEATLEAEPQVATGRFTTALEVKPILTATRANWLAVREFNGQDLVYTTHLWSWRCGLLEMKVSVNGGPMEHWPLPVCHEETAAPNAITEADGLPYRAFPQGSVQSLAVEITYDDLTTDRAELTRSQVLMP